MAISRALLVVAALAICLAAVITAVRIRRVRARVALALGITGTVGVVGLVFVVAAPIVLDQPSPIWVLGTANRSEQFSADIPHHKVAKLGSSYVFTTDASAAQLEAELDAVYPQGEAGGMGLWHVALGDTMFVLVEVTEPVDGYAVVARFVGFDVGVGVDGANVPFPVSALGHEAVTPGWAVPLAWSAAQWDDFYGQLGIKGADGVYVMPASNGMVATVTVTNDGATITLG